MRKKATKKNKEIFFKRSEAAIAELQNKYDSLALSIARHILPDERDSEECLNDAFEELEACLPSSFDLPADATKISYALLPKENASPSQSGNHLHFHAALGLPCLRQGGLVSGRNLF